METPLAEKFRDVLEKDEELLWTGQSASRKIMTPLYSPSYILSLVLSYGITGFISIMCVRQAIISGDTLDPVRIILILVVGSILPATNYANAFRANHLIYAATDKRLIQLNGDCVNSVPYSGINTAVIREDKDGFTSLLCGEEGIKLPPRKWRDIATLNNTSVPEGKSCRHFIFYAVDDIKGLRDVIQSRMPLGI